MKKFFIDNIINEDGSVLISEFKELPLDLFSVEVEMSPDIGICSILDTETTGLDFYNDEIIEIALRKWLYHRTEHRLIKPLEQYSALNQPERNEISELITELTGITKEDVQGQKIDWSIVCSFLAESDFILAHNAGFDRPMLEAVSEVRDVSSSKIWTCSLKQVDWSSKGFLSAKQELLSVFHGFHYSGHRALTDIDALSTILLDSSYLKEILANAKVKQVKVDCVRAPFDAKDTLKTSGFFWDAPNKYWSKLVPENELDKEKLFLEEKVYPQGKMSAQFTVIELKDRFKL